jgi:hypothetical protein
MAMKQRMALIGRMLELIGMRVNRDNGLIFIKWKYPKAKRSSECIRVHEIKLKITMEFKN